MSDRNVDVGQGGSGVVTTGGRSTASGSTTASNGGSTTAGSGGSGGAGGEQPGSGGSSGAAGDTSGSGGCDPVCGGATPLCSDGVCVECITGSVKCQGDTPVACVASTWVLGAPCTGSAAACSNGVCAAARLRGGIVDVAPLPAPATGLRLRGATLNTVQPTCGVVAGQPLCVRGAVQ
ncbi:MAG: hypothetical protein QM756_33590 [Polyangiaceae bacterium]